MRPSGGGLPGGYSSQEVPAQMNGGMERAQRLTQVQGKSATGLYLSIFYLLSFICQRRIVSVLLSTISGHFKVYFQGYIYTYY